MGIQDRDYYREDDRWSNPFARAQGTIFLVLLFAFVFIIQIASLEPARRGGPPPHDEVTRTLELDVGRTLTGEAWRIVSYAIVHQPWNIFHAGFTVLFLIWIGHKVEDIYGWREYLAFFTLTSLLGGIAYTAIGAFVEKVPPLLGPSGAVTAIMILFALHYPRWRILFFPIWLVIVAYALVDIAGLAGGHANPAAVGVHLAGASFAFLYHSYSLRVLNWLPGRSGGGRAARRQAQPRLRVRQPLPEPEPAATVSAGSARPGVSGLPVDEHLEAKLDQVLEKVAKHGKESLTAEEREVLLKASEIYKKRRQSN